MRGLCRHHTCKPKPPNPRKGVPHNITMSAVVAVIGMPLVVAGPREFGGLVQAGLVELRLD